MEEIFAFVWANMVSYNGGWNWRSFIVPLDVNEDGILHLAMGKDGEIYEM